MSTPIWNEWFQIHSYQTDFRSKATIQTLCRFLQETAGNHARDLGFEIDAIRTLLTLQDNPTQPCAEADSIARQKLAEVNARIESLMALKEELEAMVGGCGHRCIGECRVIEVLADHHKCLHAEH